MEQEIVRYGKTHHPFPFNGKDRLDKIFKKKMEVEKKEEEEEATKNRS